MNIIKITDMRVLLGDSAFLIDDGKTAILYDSGFGFTGGALAEKIKAYLGDRKLDYIFLTHSHYDHVLGAMPVLKYWPQAKVVAGEYAAKIFSKPSAKAVMRNLDKSFAHICGAGEYEDLTDNLRVDISVRDGDEIIAGDMVYTAVNLPGHTRCSIGFYLKNEKLLLGCETLGVFDGERDVMPLYLIGYKMSLESVEKAKVLDIENILVPHCGLLNKEQTASYLKKSYETTVETAEAIADILKTDGSKEKAMKYFKDRFYHGKIKETYPIDAMELNTSIMINIIEKELLQ